MFASDTWVVAEGDLLRQGRIGDVIWIWQSVWGHGQRTILKQYARALVAHPLFADELLACVVGDVIVGKRAGRGYGRTCEHLERVLMAYELGQVNLREALIEQAEKVAA